MQNVSIQKASELRPDVKSAVEQLLGRSIEADEEVSVRAAVARGLENFLNRRAERVRDISDAEIDSAIDEAVDRARHGRG